MNISKRNPGLWFPNLPHQRNMSTSSQTWKPFQKNHQPNHPVISSDFLKPHGSLKWVWYSGGAEEARFREPPAAVDVLELRSGNWKTPGCLLRMTQGIFFIQRVQMIKKKSKDEDDDDDDGEGDDDDDDLKQIWRRKQIQINFTPQN